MEQDNERVLEEGPDGLRAKEYGQAADVSFWTSRWKARQVNYAAAEAGHLPRQLRVTFAARVRPGARVLEAGCGLGHFTVAAAALGYEVTGVDWSEPTVRELNQRFPAIDFRQGDVRRLEFAADSFDAVYSPGVCEHFEEGPDEVLGETLRVLRPGGLAFVSTPHLNALRRWRWRAHARSGDGRAFYQYLFTPAGMSRTLERIGFQVEEVRPYAAWAGIAGEWPLLKRLPAGRAVGVFDLVPGLRWLGATAIWVARKPARR